MAGWFTRRRALGGLVALLILTALAGSVALRASKSAPDADPKAPVALEFTATIDGDAIKGDVALGPMGNAPFEGTRA